MERKYPKFRRLCNHFFRNKTSGGVNNVLSLIKTRPGIKAPELAQKLKKPKRTIERYLAQLKNEQKIEFRGSPKTGGYYLLPKIIKHK